MAVSWLSSSQSKFNFEPFLVAVILLAAAEEVSTQENAPLLQPRNGIRTRRFSAKSQETPKSAEIYVPYQCDDGYFGWHCKFQCQCATDGEVCDKRTGFCPSGCAGNNWGPGCLLDSSCYYDCCDDSRNGGFKYAGKLSGDGTSTCNLWTDPSNQYKLKNDDVSEMNVTLAKNYCRNSERDPGAKPFCNTNGGFIYCDIRKCDCPDYRFDGQNNCDKDCRCRDSNEVCNKETGACTSGCSVGWGGTGCQDCTLGQKPSATSTASGITVSWNTRLCNRSGVQGIQYVLEYAELPGGTWQSIDRSAEDCDIKCEVTVSNLLPEMVYLVRVRIRKDDNQLGPFLEDETTRVKTMCGKPRRFHSSQFDVQEVLDSNRRVIRVTWNKITDQDWKCQDGREIKIRYKNGTDADEVTQTVAANARYKDFDTAACTHWSIRIKLVNKNDNSGFSRANTITTLTSTVVAQVTSLTAGSITSTSATVHWHLPRFTGCNITGYITGYNITAVRLQGECRQLSEFQTSTLLSEITTRYTFTKLYPNSQYDISIKAISGAVQGEPNSLQIKTVEAAPGCPPGMVRFNNDTATFYWSEPSCECKNGRITEYRYLLSPVTSKCQQESLVSKEGNVSDTYVAVTGLLPFTTYSFRVRAVTVDVGPWSTNVEITTEGVEPSEVPVLTTQQLNDQGLTKFMCSGQLGHPAKGITWYQTLNGQQQNRTSEAQSSNPVLNSDSCTYNGQSELRVDISASDDGAQFTCMIGQKSASVSLTAASYPKITYTPIGALSIIDSAMDSVEFVKGSVVTLICSATGYPQPSFKWFYWEELSNTTEVLNGHHDNPSVLYLGHIQKPGYYECQASNILNQLNDPPSKVLRITLSEKSEPATGATVGAQGLSVEAIGWIIGAILGAIVIIVLACVTYTYCVKKKQKTRVGEKVSQENNAEDEVEDSELQSFLSGEISCNEEAYERPVNTNLSTEQQKFKPMEEPLYAEILERDVEIRRQNIKLMEKIGSGAFSQVFRGNIFNLDGKYNWSIAAVKTAKDTSDTSLCSEMMKELKVMLKLQTHPNVVQLLGSCTRDDAVPLIIVEYLPNGNLQDYLRNDRSKREVRYGNLHGISSSLTPHDLIKFALDVANGMSYLSSMAILHRDLAARNILVAEDRTCKISDFGFAKDVIKTHTYEKQSQGRLPIRWMSPEALFDNMYTTQSDVWAYGVLLWEIVTLGSSPYPGMSAKQVMEAITEGYRMPQPPHCSLGMYIIMSSCWEEVPSARSTFKDIVNSLDVLLASDSDVLTLGKFEEKLYEDIDKYNAEEKC